MKMRRPVMLLCASIALAGMQGGCERGGAAPPDEPHAGEEAAVPSNRVAIPPSVRSNLGISFVRVERRRVEQTLRVPGRFELVPTARREYHAMLPGRVELLVEQFDEVEAGTPLYRVESPAWIEHQEKLGQAESDIERLTTQLESIGPLRAAHHAHHEQLERTMAIRAERVEQLGEVADAGGGRRQELLEAREGVAAVEVQLAEVLETEARLEAEEAAARTDLSTAKGRMALLLRAAAMMHREPVEAVAGRWRELDALTVRADAPGVVESISLTDGAWAAPEAAVLHVVRPDRVRFRASGLQSDLGVLRDGLEARIVPPTPTATGRGVPLGDVMTGTLRLGLGANADARTVELFVTPDELRAWARPGVSAQLEIVTDATASPVLAIPLAAVQRDGLTPVIFRRAGDDPNQAVRMEADLGVDDGRWVALRSGVREGDEVVLDGAFQLMLATSGSMDKGGHFHADGTFHEGEE